MHHPFLTSLSIPLYLNLHDVYLCSIQLSQLTVPEVILENKIEELATLHPQLPKIRIFRVFCWGISKQKQKQTHALEIVKYTTFSPDVT